MKERISDKITQIEQYLEELSPMIPETFEDYKYNLRSRAVCERYFEKIIEACVDLAFLFIKENKFKMPEDDESSFIILFQNNIISEELSKKLRDAKGMRNIIAHEYGEINDEKVFNSVKNELEKDINEFLEIIRKNLID